MEGIWDTLAIFFVGLLCFLFAFVAGRRSNRKIFYKKIKSGTPLTTTFNEHKGAFSHSSFWASVIIYFVLVIIMCKFLSEYLNFDLDTNLSLLIGFIFVIIYGIFAWVFLKRFDAVPPPVRNGKE